MSLDRHIRRSGSDYALALASLLPSGMAWSRDPASILMRAITGLANIFGFVDQRAADLLEIETDPKTTVAMLPEWERAFGLPDKCLSEPLSIGDRRKALLQRITLIGEQSRPFFIALAASIGYTITITEYRPFMVGIDRVGDNRVIGTAWSPYRFDDYTRMLVNFEGVDAATTFSDVTGKAFTATGNAQIDTAQKKYGTSSFLSDGTGDAFSTPDHADFTLNSSDFTAECWFNCVATSGSQRMLFGQTGGTVATTSIKMWRDTNNFIVADVCSGTNDYQLIGTTPFTNALNTGWHHAAMVRTGNILMLFIDGVKENQMTIAGAVNNSSAAFFIGNDSAAGASWNGWIDDFRLSSKARWTANFSTAFVSQPQLNEFGWPWLNTKGVPIGVGETSEYPYILGPITNRFYWTVHVAAARLTWFRVTQSETGVDPHLRIGIASDLECLLRRYKPAHTDIIFDYSGLAAGGSMAGTP